MKNHTHDQRKTYFLSRLNCDGLTPSQYIYAQQWLTAATEAERLAADGVTVRGYTLTQQYRRAAAVVAAARTARQNAHNDWIDDQARSSAVGASATLNAYASVFECGTSSPASAARRTKPVKR